jgi:hypothetical protein
MSSVQNTATGTLSAPVENPPIKNTTPPVKKPTKRKAKAAKKSNKKPTAPKPKKLVWGDINTLSEDSVRKRIDRISVCHPCGGHRICEKCEVLWQVKLPQTWRVPDTPGVDYFDRVAEKVEVEYCCKRNFDDDRDPDTCCAEGVGALPCTLCLQFDDKGPTDPTWSYGEDLGFILNEHSLCPGCMVENPEEICEVCLHDNRGYD